VISINEGLMLELEGLTEKLNTSTTELYHLKEEIYALVSFSVKFPRISLLTQLLDG